MNKEQIASLIFQENNHKLWLGSLTDAQNKKWLKDQQIDAVFTVAIGQPVTFNDNKIRHYEYPIEDKPTFKIQKYFPEIFKLIRRELKQTNVLVHCACGVSRSATIVIGYLMKEWNIRYAEALTLVKSKRSIIKPNLGFRLVLQEWK